MNGSLNSKFVDIILIIAIPRFYAIGRGNFGSLTNLHNFPITSLIISPTFWGSFKANSPMAQAALFDVAKNNF